MFAQRTCAINAQGSWTFIIQIFVGRLFFLWHPDGTTTYTNGLNSVSRNIKSICSHSLFVQGGNVLPNLFWIFVFKTKHKAKFKYSIHYLITELLNKISMTFSCWKPHLVKITNSCSEWVQFLTIKFLYIARNKTKKNKQSTIIKPWLALLRSNTHSFVNASAAVEYK